MIYKKKNSKFWYTQFELTYQDTRKRINKSTRQTSKAKAEAFETQLRAELWQRLTSPLPEDHHFNEALELYITSRQQNRTINEKKNKLSWWNKQLVNPILRDLSTQQILSHIAKKENISIATRNRYLAELKAFLNFCHQELGWLEKVPVLKISKEPKRAFFKLSNKDIKSLLKASPDYLQPVLIFALFTGLRRSNILNLRWAEIDFERGCVFIAGENHKSKDHVTTPLSERALNLLLHLKTQSTSTYVFVNSRGRPIKDIKDKKWKEITKSADLIGLRFHDLRHNWATKHIEAGTDLLALKELGGWKTLEMVQRYAHPSDDYLSIQAKNIDNQSSVGKINELQIQGKNNCHIEDCGKKLTHTNVTEVETRDFLIVGEPQKLKNLLKISRLIMVPEAGLEPARPQRQRILNPSCLPIPPLRQHMHQHRC